MKHKIIGEISQIDKLGGADKGRKMNSLTSCIFNFFLWVAVKPS